MADIRSGIRSRGDKKPNREEAAKLNLLRSQAGLDRYAMNYLKGSVALADGDLHAALKHCKEAELADDRQPAVYLLMGEVYLAMRAWDDAENAFSVALGIDPDMAEGHVGRARALMAARRNDEAAEELFDALSLDYHNPIAHYLLGTILHRLGKIPEAILALKVAVKQNPNFVEALKRLALVYKKRLRDEGRAGEFLSLAREAAKRLKALRSDGLQKRGLRGQESIFTDWGEPPHEALDGKRERKIADQSRVITVVSGLPRSGTSMMMQMLDAGGLDVLSDGLRTPDQDNRRGYYEYEPTKRIMRDVSWLHEAEGKAIKIVAPLLRYLPSGRSYRVIFMERELGEVLSSQEAMLQRIIKQGAKRTRSQPRDILARQLRQARAWLIKRDIPVLYIDYLSCVTEPRKTAEDLSRFLGIEFNAAAAASVVDASLYRKRSGK